MSESEIKLEHPYSKDWKKGYLVTNSDGRRTVILYNSHSDRSSTSYARYLMSVKEGRYLDLDEEVDHRDDDKTNDDIGNLKIMSSEGNRNKQNNKFYQATKLFTAICECCGEEVTFTQREMANKKYNNVKNMFCSKKMRL